MMCNLIIRTDSQNAYFSLMRASSLGVWNRKLVEDILHLADIKDISLVVEKIKGVNNPADKPSRQPMKKGGSWSTFFATGEESLTFPQLIKWLQRTAAFRPSTEE